MAESNLSPPSPQPKTTPSSQYALHPSSASPAPDHSSSSSSYTAPSLKWLHGTWSVTHSTLPMWKTKRNVRITYSPLSSSSDKLDDLVTYQSSSPASKAKQKRGKESSVHGTSTPTPGKGGQFDWRGRGWLVIATSHWEVLGWGSTSPNRKGKVAAEGEGEGGEDGGYDWVVTYFSKTLFTPKGVDVYLRRREIEGGLRGKGTRDPDAEAEIKITDGIREAMKILGDEGDPEMKRLEPELFRVERD